MNEINKTLFIPLYGKALISQMGILLQDKKAEEIWTAERFALKSKAKSKWLAYTMAMRARIFDDWTAEQLRQHPDALVQEHSMTPPHLVDELAGFDKAVFPTYVYRQNLSENIPSVRTESKRTDKQ